MRHIERTRSVSISWLSERVLGPDITLRDCISEVMAAYIFTRHFVSRGKWEHVCMLIGVCTHSHMMKMQAVKPRVCAPACVAVAVPAQHAVMPGPPPPPPPPPPRAVHAVSSQDAPVTPPGAREDDPTVSAMSTAPLTPYETTDGRDRCALIARWRHRWRRRRDYGRCGLNASWTHCRTTLVAPSACTTVASTAETSHRGAAH